MIYRVEFGGGAEGQFHSLPKDAREALIERAVDLCEHPWDNAAIRPPGQGRRFRETIYGSGHGVLGFYVDDSAEFVRIFDIVWVG
ncbi:hypothetical protein [Actinomadura sp. DC4]|uniref:hypothetical protein n=1 Tax=Actinomadura sp. DC4 TaxID=3055069 RepID=UPI0025B23233|nr:hypothetical protein [Actinomadura sp. DC4]MDN3351886.1 hypothetical protein [Actinomadura sp. DC4]